MTVSKMHVLAYLQVSASPVSTFTLMQPIEVMKLNGQHMALNCSLSISDLNTWNSVIAI